MLLEMEAAFVRYLGGRKLVEQLVLSTRFLKRVVGHLRSIMSERAIFNLPSHFLTLA
jgi:predicted membrane chloride channel (bestrophin family)